MVPMWPGTSDGGLRSQGASDATRRDQQVILDIFPRRSLWRPKQGRWSQAVSEIWINGCKTKLFLCDSICRYFAVGNFMEIGSWVCNFVCQHSACPMFIGECLLELSNPSEYSNQRCYMGTGHACGLGPSLGFPLWSDRYCCRAKMIVQQLAQMWTSGPTKT